MHGHKSTVFTIPYVTDEDCVIWWMNKNMKANNKSVLGVWEVWQYFNITETVDLVFPDSVPVLKLVK